ncbi:MAG: phenylacetate-CoA oxygenase subunit PaaC [Clostridia bacterium]|nr:phenylacetate-CoA oxygenase subunit PaaC [Clostridia bacterium]
MRHVLLSLADDELVLGHRDSEWTAFAPFIEEDVALASIAQDELSHAAVYLRLLAEAEPDAPEDERDPDRLTFLRGPEAFRNARLLERPNGDWAYTCVRHLAYDLFDDLRLKALARSGYRPLAEAVDRLAREERYHLVHGRTWLARLGEAEGEARERLALAVGAVMADAPGLFEESPEDELAVAAGIVPAGPAALAAPWAEAMRAELAPIGLADRVPPPETLVRDARGDGPKGPLGGRRGRHTDDLSALLSALGEVYRSDPRASW